MNPISRRHPLVQEAAIAERLALYDLTTADEAPAAMLHDLLHPRVDVLSDRFYARLFEHAPMADFVRDQSTRDRLKGTFQRYLDTLGVGFHHPEYARQRIQVGLRHACIGLPLTFYLAGYRILQEVLLHHLFDQAPDRTGELYGFVLKITGYDTSLAVDAYHLQRTHLLQDSIEGLRQETARLTHAANTDTLTGLANRRCILDQLERLCLERDGSILPLTLAMVDLDDFKAVNDQRGHLCGDRVLTSVASVLRQGLRGEDRVGRYGGEEFMIILDGTSLEQGVRVLDRLRKQVASVPVICKDGRVPVRMSVGIAELRPGERCTELLERADKALYQAKREGKNRVVRAR